MNMRKSLVVLALCAFSVTGCRMQLVNQALNGNGSAPGQVAQTPSPTQHPTPKPTQTPAPTATLTPTPAPDLSAIGLPAENTGDAALDFAARMCDARWFTENGTLPCPGQESQADDGFVMGLNSDVQGLPAGIRILLTFPPQTGVETISSKYPEFEVRGGDRFRAVLTCRAHAFCDVDFLFNYFNDQGMTGLAHWRYLFTDAPIVVDYPLDGLAGEVVQFDLAVHVDGNRSAAYAIWIAPHIYRPPQ